MALLNTPFIAYKYQTFVNNNYTSTINIKINYDYSYEISLQKQNLVQGQVSVDFNCREAVTNDWTLE